jgi:glutaredoxin
MNTIKNQSLNFDRNSLIDKECLICLESIDIEEQKLIKLPCKCSNSIYHISCITIFINSGNNKNFCPHCKRIYNIFEQNNAEQNIAEQNIAEQNIAEQNIAEQNIAEQNIAEQNNRKNGIIFVIHIFSNTIMNVINLSVIIDKNITEKVFVIITFCKVVINFGFIIVTRQNIEKIYSSMSYSYTLQLLLLILLIYIVSNRENNFYYILLLVNNFFFFFGDLFFRINIEY